MVDCSLLSANLLVGCDAMVSESNVITDLHLVEQPVWIALQYLGQMDADVAGGLPEAIHDSAQGGFMNAQHSCQPVLSDAGRVHPQLQVWVDVSIQGHGRGLVSYSDEPPLEREEGCLLETV
jgi:hypothetical protein